MQRGYTLMEMMVVLVIMASLFAIVTPLFSSVSSASEVRAAARQMTAALRQARSTAVATRTPTAFVLDLERRTFQVEGHRVVRLPGGLELTLLTGQSELRGSGSGAIRFFADGSSTGGQITLSAESHVQQLDVAWLTGRVTATTVQTGAGQPAS